MPISRSWVRDLALVFALLTSPLTDDAQEYVPMSLLGYVTHFQGVVPVFIYKFWFYTTRLPSEHKEELV